MVGAAEFILEDGKVPIFFIKPTPAYFAKLSERLGAEGASQIVECSNPAEAINLVRRLPASLLVLHLQQKEQLTILQAMLKSFQDVLNRRQVRVVITSDVKDAIILTRLEQLGASEVLEDLGNAKSIAFKLGRHLRILSAKLKTSGGGPVVEKTDKKKAAANKASSATGAIRIVDPVALESDCWLTHGGGAKKIAGRWVVRLMGPGPLAGRWDEVESEDHSDRYWQWMPADPEKDPFIQEQGAWVFRGHKPEFEGAHWKFVGRNPILGFYYEGQSYGAKFEIALRDGALQIAKDSASALARKAAIRETFEKVIRSAKDQENQEQAKIESKKEASPEEEAESGQLEASMDFGSADAELDALVGMSAAPSSPDPSADVDAPAAQANARSEAAFKRREQAAEAAAASRAARTAKAEGEAPGHVDDAAVSTKPPGARKAGVKWVDPLNVESDFWLVMASVPRRVVGQWLIELYGPGSRAGSWEPVEGAGGRWTWQSKLGDNDPFYKEVGAWLFDGNRPELSNGLWKFSGKAPRLYFDYSGRVYGEKLASDEDGNLLIAQDSDRSKAFLPEIRKSLDDSVELAPDAEARGIQDRRGKGQEESTGEFEGVIRGESSGREMGAGAGAAVEFKDVEVHLVPVTELGGADGGEWKYVTSIAGGGKWYVFFPLTLINRVVERPEEAAPYWIYRGKERPALTEDRRAWRFLATPPKQVSRYKSLPEAIRKFIDDYFNNASFKFPEEGEAQAWGGDPSGVAKAKGAGAPKTKAPREEKRGIQDKRGEKESAKPPAADYKGEAEAPKVGAEDFAQTPDAPRVAAADFKQPPAAAPTPASLPSQAPAPGGVAAAALSEVQKALAGREFKPAPKIGEGTAQGPDAVRAEKPPGPSISPLAIALLASEIVCRPDSEAGHRFCEYISSSCGGVRAEIWWFHPSGMDDELPRCVGTSDRKAGENMRAALKLANSTDGKPFAVSKQCIVVKIPDSAGGIIVMAGYGADAIDPEYLLKVARCAHGIAAVPAAAVTAQLAS